MDLANDLGWTALAKAAHHSKPEVVRMLLASGADADFRNREEDSAWDLAVRGKHWRIMTIMEEDRVRRGLPERGGVLLEGAAFA